MKLCCVLLSHFAWRCELQRRPDLAGRPAVITCASGSRKTVFDYSPGIDGVEQDMPLQQALSRQSETVILQADMAFYREIFGRVMDRLEQVSPLVEGNLPGDIYIGCDGLDRLYPEERLLIQAVRRALPETFEARFGIADGKFPARLMAMAVAPGAFKSAAFGDIAAGIADLSCDVLPVSPKIKSRLRDFGLRRLGQVATLTRPQLEAQFGPEGRRIWELACGRDDTPLYPRLREESIEESTLLPAPAISLEVIMLAVEALLGRAFARFGPARVGIRCVELWSRTAGGEYWQKAVHFKEPAMTAAGALKRIRQVVEYCVQPGPVEELGLKVVRLGRPGGHQGSIFTEVRSSDKLESDIQQLELRMGTPPLFRVEEVEPWSRIPERRYTLIPLGR
ncbi:DNA-directed DNA polymerase [Dehalogenimonas lykanthroporepellens BL-DC-9]|nr:DNA-directed DNA polymerase [Dehalogenimonas lykanthroporepellens BL-DC-9]